MPRTVILRRALGASLAAALAATGLTLATPAAHADPGPESCEISFDPPSIRPGESTTITVTTSDDLYFPAILMVDGHIVPGATVGMGPVTFAQDYSWWHSFGEGATTSAGYRVYSSDTAMGEVDDETPSLCEGEVDFLPALTAQTIDFPAPADTLLSQGTMTLDATASSELQVGYASDTPGVCTVDGDEVTLVARGQCSITASQPGDGTYAAATDVQRSFWVQVPQTVTFPVIPDTLLSVGTVQLNATATSGNYIEYATADASICSVPLYGAAAYDRDASAAPPFELLTLHKVGTCTVIATQWGGGGWLRADATRSFKITVAADAPVLTLTVPVGVARSQGKAGFTARSTAGAPAVRVTSATPAVCTVASASTVRLVKAGTCTLTAAQAGAASVTRSFPVWRAPAIPAKGRTTQSIAVLGKGESSLRVTAGPAKVCRASKGEVLLIAPGTCRVRITRDGAKVRGGSIEVDYVKSAKPSKRLKHGGTVLFDFNSAKLTKKAKRSLRGHLATLRKASVVIVYGNTFGPGKNSDSSRELAADRAAAVVKFLRKHGVKASAVTVAAAMENPVSKDPAKNRRADIYYRN